MPHALISGTTLSGKTTLAKQLAHHYKEAGFGIIVLDPMCDPEWPVHDEMGFITDDPDEFLEAFWDNKECMVFIDEAGESAGHYDKPMITTATRGRHWGHTCHYLSQRPALLSKSIRSNCHKLHMFAANIDDSKELSKEFCCPELLNAVNLRQGEFYSGGRFIPFTRQSLF
jgi:hypothetical protein